MGVISSLLVAIVHIFLVVLDLTILFLVIRILRRWWTHRLIGALDALGAPLVDEVSAYAGTVWRRVFPGSCPSSMGRVALALTVAVVVRWIIGLVSAPL